jgi:hypothetical protein
MADHHVPYINIYTNSKHWFNIWVKFLDFDSVTSEQLPSEQLQVGQVDHQIALGGSVEAPEWGGWAKPAGPVVEGPFFFVGSWSFWIILIINISCQPSIPLILAATDPCGEFVYRWKSDVSFQVHISWCTAGCTLMHRRPHWSGVKSSCSSSELGHPLQWNWFWAEKSMRIAVGRLENHEQLENHINIYIYIIFR